MEIPSLSSNVTATTKLETGTNQVSGLEDKVTASSVVSPNVKPQQETEKVNQEQVDSLNVELEKIGLGMTFSVDENTKSSIIKLIDKTTEEVIKQFPSEGSLKIMMNIQSYLNSVQNDLPNKESLTGTLLSEII